MRSGGAFRAAGSGNGGAGYTTAAVNFDGTNDYITHSADLTGAANSKLGILSAWVNRDADGLARFIDTKFSLIQIIFLSGNTFQIQLRNASGAGIILSIATSAIVDADGWTHIMASWDMAGPTTHLYVDGVSDNTVTTATDATIDYTHLNWTVGAEDDGDAKYTGDIADLYFNTAEYLDLSVAGNRAKFIDASGKPVDLGADGSTPTGTAPIMFHKADAATPANFANNLGGGGNFTVQGALTNASSTPSD